jgi:A/G-specific adenine glycosylase
LGTWFDKHGKDLPWRRRKDAYSVWVSEIMLQQTQVATVCGYFDRFLAAFPTVETLAQADEEQVLRLWEGLGYYRRARQLHAAAKTMVHEYHGEFPCDIEKVRRLPGIGRYTAGAILSIAFDIPQPILEANTIRVYSRLLGFEGDPHSVAGQKLLWSFAEAILPPKRPGRLNQSLMELGREVCKSRRPSCASCPVAAECKALQNGLQESIPRPKAKPKFEQVHEAAVVVRRRGRILLLKRGDGGRWAGLWDFPRFAIHAEHPDAIQKELREGVRRLTGVEISSGELLKTLRHAVTRFRITLDCFAGEFASESKHKTSTEIKWVPLAELEKYPLNTTGRKIAQLIS